MPGDEDSPKSSSDYVTCRCSDCDKMQLMFEEKKDLLEDNTSVDTSVDQKDRLFENVKLSEVADKLEAVLERAKELELNHLIEPIQTVARKLRNLDDITEQLACDYYDCYPCANKTCCNEVVLATKEGCPSGDSCACSSCHCGSSSDEQQPHKSETYCIDKPCETCDCTGGVRSLADETCAWLGECYFEAKPRSAEPTPSPGRCCVPEDSGDIIVERTISNSRVEVKTNLKDLSLAVNRENTTIKDTTYVRVKEKSQGILCDLSGESSTDYDSECSSANGLCYSPNYRAGGEEHNRQTHFYTPVRDDGRDSGRGSCGCGESSHQQPAICPCGCGDAVGPADHAASCRCENCGKEITQGRKQQRDDSFVRRVQARKARVEELRGRHEQMSQEERVARERRLQYTDLKSYIEDLEDKCLEKSRIIEELTKELKRSEIDEPKRCLRAPTYII